MLTQRNILALFFLLLSAHKRAGSSSSFFLSYSLLVSVLLRALAFPPYSPPSLLAAGRILHSAFFFVELSLLEKKKTRVEHPWKQQTPTDIIEQEHLILIKSVDCD